LRPRCERDAEEPALVLGPLSPSRARVALAKELKLLSLTPELEARRTTGKLLLHT
jgi:hypothetical protein